jgi:methyl-accepting chemotaxis protein
VLVIVGQRANKVAEYYHARRLALPILIDPDRSVIKRYEVYHRFGLTAYNIARPATFIIDRDQRLRFMYVGKGQSDRPDHATLVSELEKLHPRQSTSPPPEAPAPPTGPAPR